MISWPSHWFPNKTPAPELPIFRARNREAYLQLSAVQGEQFQARLKIERELIPSATKTFKLRGYCCACTATVKFSVDFLYAFTQDDGHAIPNWRERLVCPRCGLNNRMRVEF